MKPVVAIIGRPNVGKSSFFNYIIGSRISIVEDTPGVTRDRVYGDASWRDKEFVLIDTGGIDNGQDEISIRIKEQANIAINIADVILFMTDIKQGVTIEDLEIAKILKKSKKPVIVVCNKTDNIGALPAELYEFYNLGLGEPMPISASNALGLGDLLDKVYEALPNSQETEDDGDIIKVAIIGKPNAR